MHPPNTAKFRFYEELNDFLPRWRKKSWFDYRFYGSPAIKDAIESIGIPHVEVDLILANGESVTFDYQLQNSDEVSVYPVFESFDISTVTKLRAKPLRNPRFILDVHLGKLCKYLRMLGFDTLYENNYDDPEIIEIAERENRIILTRDLGILKTKIVTRGYWIRSQNVNKQLQEVVKRFDLKKSAQPFYRCIACNGIVKQVDKNNIQTRLEPNTTKFYHEFFQCTNCCKVFWKGSHYENMKNFVNNLITTPA